MLTILHNKLFEERRHKFIIICHFPLSYVRTENNNNELFLNFLMLCTHMTTEIILLLNVVDLLFHFDCWWFAVDSFNSHGSLEHH